MILHAVFIRPLTSRPYHAGRSLPIFRRTRSQSITEREAPRSIRRVVWRISGILQNIVRLEAYHALGNTIHNMYCSPKMATGENQSILRSYASARLRLPSRPHPIFPGSGTHLDWILLKAYSILLISNKYQPASTFTPTRPLYILMGQHECNPTVPKYLTPTTCAGRGHRYILRQQYIAVFRYDRQVYIENISYCAGCETY